MKPLDEYSREAQSGVRLPKIPLYGAFLALVTGTIIWGIVPALEKPNTDFSNYYVGARLLRESRSLANLYERAWFEEQIERYGIENQPGTFVPFPPATALVLLPVAHLSPQEAKITWTAANALFLVGCIYVLSRTIRRPWVDAGVLLLLSGLAIINGFRFGQLYFLLLLLILAGFWAAQQHRDVLSGILFGLLVPIKYFPLVFLLYFAWVRRWKIVLWGAMSSGLVFILGIVVLGWNVHEIFFK